MDIRGTPRKGTVVAGGERYATLEGGALHAAQNGPGAYRDPWSYQSDVVDIRACEGPGAFLLPAKMLQPLTGEALKDGWYVVTGVARTKESAERAKPAPPEGDLGSGVTHMSRLVKFPTAEGASPE